MREFHVPMRDLCIRYKGTLSGRNGRFISPIASLHESPRAATRRQDNTRESSVSLSWVNTTPSRASCVYTFRDQSIDAITATMYLWNESSYKTYRDLCVARTYDTRYIWKDYSNQPYGVRSYAVCFPLWTPGQVLVCDHGLVRCNELPHVCVMRDANASSFLDIYIPHNVCVA